MTTMTSTMNMAIRRLTTSQMRQLAFRTSPEPLCLSLSRAYSTRPPPPLLSRLKTDLKTAMREKDAPRLSVLRTILAEATNAEKTEKPIKSDAHVVQLLKKARRGNQEAMEEARKAKRQDLVEKEETQLWIIDQYIAGSSVIVLEEAELRSIVEKAIEDPKESENVFGRLMGKDWQAENKYVDRGMLARVINEMLKEKKKQ